MNQDERVRLENIQEVIGEAATYLMNSRKPVDADNLLMVLRTRSGMTTDPRQKQVLDASLQYLKARILKTA
ncbi:MULTISPECIES: hypothetical protein [unclassified Enterobacter]|uniref:hypothetical protein n=1 Tax=unclassified Enterobacter TaxID=2608935 RepID=UPI0011601A21|nr:MULTISPECIES: hypothetical protein [unclassified Enterobacter]